MSFSTGLYSSVLALKGLLTELQGQKVTGCTKLFSFQITPFWLSVAQLFKELQKMLKNESCREFHSLQDCIKVFLPLRASLRSYRAKTKSWYFEPFPALSSLCVPLKGPKGGREKFCIYRPSIFTPCWYQKGSWEPDRNLTAFWQFCYVVLPKIHPLFATPIECVYAGLLKGL